MTDTYKSRKSGKESRTETTGESLRGRAQITNEIIAKQRSELTQMRRVRYFDFIESSLTRTYASYGFHRCLNSLTKLLDNKTYPENHNPLLLITQIM